MKKLLLTLAACVTLFAGNAANAANAAGQTCSAIYHYNCTDNCFTGLNGSLASCVTVSPDGSDLYAGKCCATSASACSISCSDTSLTCTSVPCSGTCNDTPTVWSIHSTGGYQEGRHYTNRMKIGCWGTCTNCVANAGLCACDTGTLVLEYRCAAGYYGTANAFGTSGCTICPDGTYKTSAGNAASCTSCPPNDNAGWISQGGSVKSNLPRTSVLDCYISGNFSDSTGTFEVSDCDYSPALFNPIIDL